MIGSAIVNKLVVCGTLKDMSVRYSVIHSLKGPWRVKRYGANRATSVHSTQREAVDKARELAKRANGGEVIVHRVDGTVKSWSTYNRNPSFPREQSYLKK